MGAKRGKLCPRCGELLRPNAAHEPLPVILSNKKSVYVVEYQSKDDDPKFEPCVYRGRSFRAARRHAEIASACGVGLEYQPDEMGDTLETVTFGVAITGRYWPTFADWKDPNGTLDPMIFDGALGNMQRIAEEAIGRELPEFAPGAVWMVKSIFY